MWKILSKVKEHLSISILLSMIIGLVIGYFADTSVLNNLIIPLTIVMVFPMMVNINLKQIFDKGDKKILIMSQMVNFIIIPLIAFGIGSLFFANQPYVFIGFMLMAVLPTSGMTISWTGFTKGNIGAAIKITILGLILGAFIGPVILNLIFGQSISIPALKIITQILIVVLIPLTMGMLTKKLMLKKIGQEKYDEKWKKRFPLLSSIGIIFVIFIATSLKAKAIIQNPTMVLLLIVPVVIFYVVNFIFTTLLGRYFCKEYNRSALVYGTVMRNLSVALAIAMTVFDSGNSSIALIIAISYIFQVQFAALYVRIFNKISGKIQTITT